MNSRLRLERLEDRTAPAIFTTKVDNSHVDLAFNYLGASGFNTDGHIHNEDTGTVTDASATMLYVRPSALMTLPAGFEFIGPAGSSVYIAPQTQNPNLLYAGFSAEDSEPGVFSYLETDPRVNNIGPWIRIELVSFAGPGEFALYQVNGAGQTTVWMRTNDGISSMDANFITSGGHQHYNFAFTARGVYEITLQASARTGPNSTDVVTSVPVTFYFSVDAPGPTNVVPASVAPTAGVAFAFTGANAVSIQGPTTAPGELRTVLSVNNGTLEVNTTAGVNVLGLGTNSLTLTGKLADVNAALATLRYTGNGGPDALTIATDDQGEYKPAPNNVQSDTDTITLNVSGTVPPTVPPGVPPTVPPGVPPTVPPGVPPGVPPVVPPPAVPVSGSMVTGTDVGGGPIVNVFNADGLRVNSFLAYDANFRGGVRVASADLNGDGVADIVTAPGPGGGPHIKVFDGATGEVLLSFFAFAPSFSGGVNIALGDLDGDGVREIIVGAGLGGGPHVRAFSFRDGREVVGFFAYASTLRDGVNVAAGDLNGDGRDEIVIGAGPGGGPNVRVYNPAMNQLSTGFFADDVNLRTGVNVAVGDIDGNGVQEIITGTASAFGPRVQIFRGDFRPAGGFVLSNVVSSTPPRVAAVDTTANGRDEILVPASPGERPTVRVFDARSGVSVATFSVYDPSFLGGVFVG